MSTVTRCAFVPRVHAHFDRGLSPEEDRALFSHLPTCVRCSSLYERHLVLASLDPEAVDAKARIQRGLPRAPASKRPRMRWVTPTAGALALAAALLLLLKPHHAPDDGFHPRGDASSIDASSRLSIYRVTAGAPPRSIDDRIAHTDELAFAYANPEGKRFLLVFATDENGKTYWYYPAWTRGDENPTAVPIEPSTALVELPAAITHSFEASRLRVHAVFSDVPLSVREVESRLEATPPLSPTLGFPGTLETSRLLELSE